MVGPELFELLANVFGDMLEPETISDALDFVESIFGTVDDEIDGDF